MKEIINITKEVQPTEEWRKKIHESHIIFNDIYEYDLLKNLLRKCGIEPPKLSSEEFRFYEGTGPGFVRIISKGRNPGEHVFGLTGFQAYGERYNNYYDNPKWYVSQEVINNRGTIDSLHEQIELLNKRLFKN